MYTHPGMRTHTHTNTHKSDDAVLRAAGDAASAAHDVSNSAPSGEIAMLQQPRRAQKIQVSRPPSACVRVYFASCMTWMHPCTCMNVPDALASTYSHQWRHTHMYAKENVFVRG
jgi:hypothetical protein